VLTAVAVVMMVVGVGGDGVVHNGALLLTTNGA
jgi:hypothetical protein